MTTADDVREMIDANRQRIADLRLAAARRRRHEDRLRFLALIVVLVANVGYIVSGTEHVWRASMIMLLTTIAVMSTRQRP